MPGAPKCLNDILMGSDILRRLACGIDVESSEEVKLAMNVGGPIRKSLRASCRRVASDTPKLVPKQIIFSGWLRHQSVLFALWRERWFALTPTALYIYKHENFGGLERIINLRGCQSVVFVSPRLMRKERHCFAIEMVPGAGMRQTFIAASVNAKQPWMEELRKAIRSFKPQIPEHMLHLREECEDCLDVSKMVTFQPPLPETSLGGPDVNKLGELERRLLVSQSDAERLQCAHALACCRIAGTAPALRHALERDSASHVRQACAQSFGDTPELAPEQIIFSGWLQHRSIPFALWHERWFALTPTALYIYKHENFGGLVRIINLRGCQSIVFVSPWLMRKERHCFAIEMMPGAGMRQTFIAASANAKLRWMEELRKAIRSCKQHIPEHMLHLREECEDCLDVSKMVTFQPPLPETSLGGPDVNKLEELERRLLVSQSDAERLQCAHSLACRRSTDTAPALRHALEQDSASHVRQACAKSLGELGEDSEINKSLLHAMRHDAEACVRLAAANALGKRGLDDGKSVLVLRETLETDADNAVRSAVVTLLGQLAELQVPMAISAIHFALSSDSCAAVRIKAAEATAEARVDESRLVLEYRLQEDPDENARLSCASALLRFGDVSVPALLRAVRADAACTVRASVAELLCSTKTADVRLVECLQEAMQTETHLETWRRIRAALDAA